MGLAFRVLWTSFKSYYDDMFALAGANLVWVAALALATVPAFLQVSFIPPLVGIAASLVLLVLLVAPATGGILYLTNRIAHRKRIEFRILFDGAREYYWKSVLLALLNLAAGLLCAVNFVFYNQFDAQWAIIPKSIFVTIAAVWCLIQIYVFPMLLEQDEPRLRLALRNAAFLTFASPLTSLILGILMVLLATLSIGLTLPFMIAMAPVLGLMANGAVLELLVRLGIRKPPEDELED